MSYFSFFFLYRLQNLAFYVLRAHLHLDQPHFKCSAANVVSDPWTGQRSSRSGLRKQCPAGAKNGFCISNWLETIKRRLFHDMGKLHEIQISTSINKTALAHNHFHLHIVYGCFVLQQQSWVGKTEPYGPQSIKFYYLAINRKKLCCPLF